MAPVVNVFCIVFTEPKRDTTSPRCRRSKNPIGKRTMWANMLPIH